MLNKKQVIQKLRERNIAGPKQRGNRIAKNSRQNKVQQTCDVNKVLDFWCIDLLIPEHKYQYLAF